MSCAIKQPWHQSDIRDTKAGWGLRLMRRNEMTLQLQHLSWWHALSPNLWGETKYYATICSNANTHTHANWLLSVQASSHFDLSLLLWSIDFSNLVKWVGMLQVMTCQTTQFLFNAAFYDVSCHIFRWRAGDWICVCSSKNVCKWIVKSMLSSQSGNK